MIGICNLCSAKAVKTVSGVEVCYRCAFMVEDDQKEIDAEEGSPSEREDIED